MGYVKQGFKDGDVLNASQLVKIEQGIQDNEKETAKKEERIIFTMHAKAGGLGQYVLEFEDGNTFDDVKRAILSSKDVFVQINGNETFMDGDTILLPYAGNRSNGVLGFTYSVADGEEIRVISVALNDSFSMLIEMNPILSVDDTFWTQENRNNLATVLEKVPIVADSADEAASINTVRNSFISALRGGVTPAEPVLVSISVMPTSITVPSGTVVSQVKDYLTSMTGYYETEGVAGQTTKDLTSQLGSVAVNGTMPTAGNTSTMTISYGGKSTTVSVTMEKAAPTLTGLTATYTGGTVAAGTTLSQLTEVVKATYSDGTTSAALTKGTDYTLSGTLTAGQANTVTVTGAGTYAGFTTSFSVTVEGSAAVTSSSATGSVGSEKLNNSLLNVTQNIPLSSSPNKITCLLNYVPSNKNIVGKMILTKNSDGNWEGDFWRKSDVFTPENVHHFVNGSYATVTVSDNKVTSIKTTGSYFSESLPNYILKFCMDSAAGVPAYDITVEVV